MVEHLLSSGADPHALNKAGQTALMMAERKGSADVVALLKGADMDAQTHHQHQSVSSLLTY
jgi:ankyrin repeat protein